MFSVLSCPVLSCPVLSCPVRPSVRPSVYLSVWWRNAVDRFEFQSREKFLGIKTIFLNLFLDHDIFLIKKSHQYPNSNSPLFVRIVKKRIGSFSQRYCRLQKIWKVKVFLIGHFWALWPLHTTDMAHKCCQTQKYPMGLLFLSALSLNAQLIVFLECLEKTALSAFPQKSSTFSPIWVHPRPSGEWG